MIKSSTFKPQLSKLYYLYEYNTPVGVMSYNEAIVFNLIVFTSVALCIYWAATVLPLLCVRLVESTYFYLTENTLPVGLIASLYFSRKVFWPVSTRVIPQPGNNITRIGKERLLF